MYGAVRKSFPNCLDIVSYKMLELKICYIKILPSKIKTQWLFVRHPYGDLYLLFVRESEDFIGFLCNS